ncbi:MAG: MFS transporter [candidate division KSB1 bacterium]|nr:MFS transporter [candidate division KSB1 bacterium]
MFRALRHRNYRLHFFGQLLSFTGSWIQNVAQGWLVYELTHSAFWLGLIGFLNFLPISLFSLVGGSIADRFSKRRLLLMTQVAAMVLALLFAALVWTGAVRIGWIGIWVFGFGVANAFEIPTRQAFVIELVGKEDLMNGIALNSAIFNIARLLGPAIGAAVIATLGIGWCLFLNGLSYLAVIGSLLAMRFPNQLPRPTPAESLFRSIREIFLYIRQTRPVYGLLILVGTMTIFGWSFSILMPVFAAEILQGGAIALGKLMSASGLGALAGALFVAGLGHRFVPRRLLFAGLTIFTIAISIFALSKTLVLSLILMVIAGFGIILFYVNANNALQRRVPDHLRGRIMGMYAFAFGGLTPVGSLQAGFISEKFGAPSALIMGAIICVLAAYLISRMVPPQPREPQEKISPIPRLQMPDV